MVITSISLSTNVQASGRGVCSQDRYDVKPRMGHAKVQSKVESLIRCVTNRWSVPGGAAKMIDVGICESHLWPWVLSDTGKYIGLYQHNRYSWESRAHKWLKDKWFNLYQWKRIFVVPNGAFLARAHVILTARMVHSGGWKPWSCA